MESLATRCDFRDQDLRVKVPWTDQQPVKILVDTGLPDVVITEGLRPDAYHAPADERDDADDDGIEHGHRT